MKSGKSQHMTGSGCAVSSFQFASQFSLIPHRKSRYNRKNISFQPPGTISRNNSFPKHQSMLSPCRFTTLRKPVPSSGKCDSSSTNALYFQISPVIKTGKIHIRHRLPHLRAKTNTVTTLQDLSGIGYLVKHNIPVYLLPLMRKRIFQMLYMNRSLYGLPFVMRNICYRPHINRIRRRP